MMDQLSQAARLIAQATTLVDEEMSRLAKQNKLPEGCRFYKQIRDAYDLVDTQRKALHELVERSNHSLLPELFSEADSTSITLEFPGDNNMAVKYRFTKSLRFTASMLDKDGGKDWLRANGAGDLIQETVNAGTLSSYAKNLMETEGKELPPELFKTGTMPTTSITKA